MTSPYSNILRRLAARDKITPFFEAGVLDNNWPAKYTIEIDSSPYYGLGDGKFHPSTHPLLGERLLWYMFHPLYYDKLVQERRSVIGEMTLTMGSALHGIMQTQFKMMGLCECNCEPGEQHTCRDIEVEYTNEQYNVRGRLDFLVHHPDGNVYPVELKTMNSYSFAKLQPDVISLQHDIQMSLEEDCLGYSEGVLLVAEAGWPYNLKEFPHIRNDRLLSEVYQKFDRVTTAVQLDIPPKHCCAYGSAQNKSCPARFVCWDVDKS